MNLFLDDISAGVLQVPTVPSEGARVPNKPWIWFDEFFSKVVGTTNLKINSRLEIKKYFLLTSRTAIL